MSRKARIFKPDDELKRVLQSAPPKSAAEAIARANANLAEFADKCAADVEESLNLLGLNMIQMSSEPNAENCCTLYNNSSRIIGAADVVGAHELVALAQRLCDLLDKQAKEKTFDPEPVSVLVNAMIFLFKTRNDGVDTSQLRDGLDMLMDHYGTKAPNHPG